MTNLLTLSYWFKLSPETLIPLALKLFITTIILLAILVVVAAINKKKTKLYRRFWRRIHNFSFTNTLIGLIFLFFNYESVPFFSARFWLGLWILSMIIWVVFIILGLKKIPEKKEELEKEQEYKKYLP